MLFVRIKAEEYGGRFFVASTEPRLGSEPLVGESSSASQLAVQFLLPSSSDSCITPALDRDLEVVGHEALLSIPNFKNLELIEVQNNHK